MAALSGYPEETPAGRPAERRNQPLHLEDGLLCWHQEVMTVSTLTVRLFGHFSVRRDDQVVAGFESSKVQELFSYLLLHPNHPYARDSVAGLLWADLPTVQSKKRLSQTLWQLQSALHGHNDPGSHDHPVRVESELLQLDSIEGLWLDVRFF